MIFPLYRRVTGEISAWHKLQSVEPGRYFDLWSTYHGINEIGFVLPRHSHRSPKVPCLRNGIWNGIFLDDFSLERARCECRGVAQLDAHFTHHTFKPRVCFRMLEMRVSKATTWLPDVS